MRPRPAPASDPAQRRRGRIVIGVSIAIVVAAVAGLVGITAVSYARIDRLSVRLPGSASGGATYLLVGSDTRADLGADEQRAFGTAREAPGEHADLILLLRVPDHGRAKLLAIPRDLVVLDDAGNLDRLGLVYRHGPQHLVDTLCGTLGLGVDHLVVMRFAGFEQVIDALGGIDVELPTPFLDGPAGIVLPAGNVHLDGRGALSYVRARHVLISEDDKWFPEPDSALRRNARARQVLEAIAGDAPGLSDPLGFARSTWATTGAMAIDDAQGVRDLMALPDALRSISSAREVPLPVTLVNGPVPTASLDDGARAALREFAAASQGSGRRHDHPPPCARTDAIRGIPAD